jgi:hypothetical protein
MSPRAQAATKATTDMQIRAGFEIQYRCIGPTPMILARDVDDSRACDPVRADRPVTSPALPGAACRNLLGSGCGRLAAPPGRFMAPAGSFGPNTLQGSRPAPRGRAGTVTGGADPCPLAYHRRLRNRGQDLMPPERQEERRWRAPLGDRLSAGTDVGQVADTILTVWQEIDRALGPIVGDRGVAAMYNRSLKLTAVAHPWLASASPDMLAAVDLPALKAALLQQTAAQAAAGGSALFETFRELLASLVGAALTERLLRSVWTPSSGASPAQDPSS